MCSAIGRTAAGGRGLWLPSNLHLRPDRPLLLGPQPRVITYGSEPRVVSVQHRAIENWVVSVNALGMISEAPLHGSSSGRTDSGPLCCRCAHRSMRW